MTQTDQPRAQADLGNVFVPDFARCPDCRERLVPQKRQCPACGSRRVPVLMRGLWLVALGAGVAGAIAALCCYLISLAGGGDSDRWLVLAMAGAAIALLSLPFARVLRGGGTQAWYAWTTVLGMILGGAAMFMMILLSASDQANPLLAFAFLGVTIGYLGWMWRTVSTGVWAAASAAYLLLTVAGAIWMIVIHTDEDVFVAVVGMNAILVAAAALLAITYAVPVRWWHGAALGWTGGKIDETFKTGR